MAAVMAVPRIEQPTGYTGNQLGTWQVSRLLGFVNIKIQNKKLDVGVNNF